MKKSITSEEYSAFLRLLISHREQAGLTQTQLAERIEETQSFVSKLERGERRIDVLEFLAICDALGISPSEFIAELQHQLQGGH